MDYLESQIKQIKSLNKDENIITYKTISHGGFLTYDGIDVNGKRIANEITAETDKLTSNGNGVKKFSILGYSLGGLISRYAIGVLYYEGYFEKVLPVNFITFLHTTCWGHQAISFISGKNVQWFSVLLSCP